MGSEKKSMAFSPCFTNASMCARVSPPAPLQGPLLKRVYLALEQKKKKNKEDKGEKGGFRGGKKGETRSVPLPLSLSFSLSLSELRLSPL